MNLNLQNERLLPNERLPDLLLNESRLSRLGRLGRLGRLSRLSRLGRLLNESRRLLKSRLSLYLQQL